MKVPQKYYDEIFSFKGQWDLPSSCGLKIINSSAGGRPPVVIVTELYQDNPGTSAASAGLLLARQICREKGLELDKIIYLECNPGTNSKLSFYDEEIFKVDFIDGAKPVYRQLSASELMELLPEGLQ